MIAHPTLLCTHSRSALIEVIFVKSIAIPLLFPQNNIDYQTTPNYFRFKLLHASFSLLQTYGFFEYAGVCSALEAKEGPQIQNLLERLPLRSRVRSHQPQHRQHLWGIRHLEPRERVEKGIHCSPHIPRIQCSHVGGIYMVHCHQEEEEWIW